MPIFETQYTFPNQTGFYKGKVRDVYSIGDQLIIIASDRISAFDYVLPEPIPYKGQVLTQIANYFLDATSDIVPNWKRSNPDSNVTIGQKCIPIKLELVVRGYLAGHSWREYSAGVRAICGVNMPEGMIESESFPTPIITPATKAEEGHDEDISYEDILKADIVTKSQLDLLYDYSLKLFQRGSEMARKQGLILVDTKYEFGFHNGEILLIDEIHTPDSSRYYYLEGYTERQEKGVRQKQLSKEFVREWLMENDFQGLEGQKMPKMPAEFVNLVSQRYIELYEKITGLAFEKRDQEGIQDTIYQNILRYLS